jgi:hypothetical protein
MQQLVATAAENDVFARHLDTLGDCVGQRATSNIGIAVEIVSRCADRFGHMGGGRQR